MRRKIISLFFGLLFLIQVLPVKQVGRILFQASMIEELLEKNPAKSTTGFEDHLKAFLFQSSSLNFSLQNSRHISYIHLSETLPVLRASDVQTPPPDFS